MFCQHCGFSLQAQAKFCPECGKQVVKIPEKKQTAEVSSRIEPQNLVASGSEFNRDVLVSYLHQLRTLEFSAQKFSNDLNNLDYRISRLGAPAYKPEPYRRRADVGDDIYMIGFGIVVAIIASFIYGFIPWGLFNWARILAILLVVGEIIAIAVKTSNAESANSENEVKASKEYEQNLKREKQEQEEKARLMEIRPDYVSRLEKAQMLRGKAYDIDIIPAQFRNIYAIYYFYDYLSTSQSTLESAMLHFDLNEIKQKLNQIIEQQQQIIFQQAQILANTDTMIRQQDELIQRAIRTERNTKYAAQYSEVAAVNSETIAFTNTVIAAAMIGQL